MNDFDKILQDSIRNDELPFEADPASIHRLKNHMRLIPSRSSVRMNIISPIINIKQLRALSAIKVGIICLLFLTFFGYHHITSHSAPFTCTDSTMASPVTDTSFLFTEEDSTGLQL